MGFWTGRDSQNKRQLHAPRLFLPRKLIPPQKPSKRVYVLRESVQAMTVLMVVLALLAGLGGFTSLSQATMGVGIICIGCLLAILGRIAQAAEQHRDIKTLLERIS
jgi:hypothetical protein